MQRMLPVHLIALFVFLSAGIPAAPHYRFLKSQTNPNQNCPS